METAPLVMTLLGVAIVVAVFAGGWAANVLLRAAETRRRVTRGGGDQAPPCYPRATRKGLSALVARGAAGQARGVTGAALTALTCIVLTVGTVALIAVANWPGRTPQRPLGSTRELAPFERL